MNEFLINQEGYLRVASFLSKLNVGGIINVNPQKTKPMPTTLYANAKFSAGGTADILTTNVVQEQGVTNFDGNKLEVGRNFVISGVTIRYGVDEATKKVYEVDYSKDLPPVLLNSSLIIRQENEVLLDIPIMDIELSKKTEKYFKILDAFALIKESYPVDVQIKTPAGSTIDTQGKQAFVSVMLQGFETKTKR